MSRDGQTRRVDSTACDNSHAAAVSARRPFISLLQIAAAMTATEDPRIATLWTALATVIDPELGLDIVTLGLVYGVELDGASAAITYTLTTPGCPMERVITDGVRAAALAVEGIQRVDTHIVWEPAWHPGMIAPSAF